MCRRVLVVVFWLLAVELLSNAAGPLIVPLSVPLWNGFDDVRLEGFTSRANAFLLAQFDLSFLSPTVFSFIHSTGWLYKVGVFGLTECSQSLPA